MTNEERATRAKMVRIARALSTSMAATEMQQTYMKELQRGHDPVKAMQRSQTAYDRMFGEAMLGWLAMTYEALCAAAENFGIPERN